MPSPSSVPYQGESHDALCKLLDDLPKSLIAFESRLTDIERQVSQMSGEHRHVLSLKNEVDDLKGKMQNIERLSTQEASDKKDSSRAVLSDQALEEAHAAKPDQSSTPPAELSSRSSFWIFKRHHTRSYALEQNVYGLMLMPSRRPRVGAWLLLLIHYVLVAGITSVIHLTTLSTAGDVNAAARQLCQDVNGAWDCSEPMLKSMMEFAVADADGDGRWSMPEARASGTLSQFQALHDIASRNDDILKLVAPPKDAVPNLFCDSFMPMLHAGVSTGLMDFNDGVKIAKDSMGLTLDDMRKQAKELNYCELPSDADEYFRVIACVMHHKCRTSPDFRSSPAISSTEQYSNATGQYSFFPESVLKVLTENLLRPCLLVDKDQCANAEIKSNFLREVPIWQDLDSAERVKRCVSHVRNVCPHILGDRFQTHAQQMKDMCGARSYAQERVPAPARKTHKHMPSCEDDNILLQKFVAQLSMEDEFLALAVEKFGGVSTIHCFTTGMLLGMCQAPGQVDLRSSVTDLKGNMTQRPFLWKVMSRFCPDTCCKQQTSPIMMQTVFFRDDKQAPHIPLACDSKCFQAEKHGSPNLPKSTKDVEFPLECFGEYCNLLQVSEPGFGNVRISFRNAGFTLLHSMRIIVYSNRSLIVHILSIFSGGDPDCLDNSLQIDGTRSCKENLHKNLQVFAPLRKADSFEILFQPSRHGCVESSEPGSCDWDIVVSDAGERDEYTMSLTSFTQQIRFGGESGVRSSRFSLFFSLVLVVWLVFMSEEISALKHQVLFILQCPQLDLRFNFRGQRTFLLMCVALPRFIIWCWVIYVGVKLLSLSTDPIEIVLNSVALAFIMEIDETLYITMAAQDAKNAMRSLDEFVWQRHALDFDINPNLEIFIKVLLMMLVVSGFVIYEYVNSGGWLQTASMVDCICLLQGPHCASGVLT